MLIGFVGVAIFSLTLPFTRVGVQEMNPFYISFGRGVIAGLCGLIFLVISKSPFPSKVQYKKILITAFGVVYGFPIFTSLAMQTLPSAHSGIVLGALPLATSAIGAMRFGERPSFTYWLTAITGTLIVILYSIISGGGSLAYGDIWLLLAIVTAAIGYAEGGRLAQEIGAVRVVSWAMVLTLPLNIPATYIFSNVSVINLSPGALLSFLYIGLFSAYIGFFFLVWRNCIGGYIKTQSGSAITTLFDSNWRLLHIVRGNNTAKYNVCNCCIDYGSGWQPN